MFKRFLNILMLSASFITCSSSKSQTSGGQVFYEIERDTTVVLDLATRSNPFRINFLNTARELEFELNFNKKRSVFKLVDKLPIDRKDADTHMTVFILRGRSLFYSNLDKNILLEQKELFGELVRVEKNFEELNWELTNDKKRIGDYTCFKATGIKYGKDKNHKTTETPITVWYCPELSYRFGPFEATGLPGLVLEYSLGEFIWKASKIKFSEKEMTTQAPKEGRLISEDEINNAVEKKAKLFLKGNH